MKYKRLFAAVLACLMLVSCGPNRTEPLTKEPDETSGTSEKKTIAYVPLDDRPDNEERVIYLAESLGYTLNMPERSLYKTWLDGQPAPEERQCGDRAALYEWVLEQEKSGCDRYILFLDQLLSGGLVSSRAMRGENPIQLSTGEVLTETAVLQQLLETLAEDEENRVWLLDTVIRLAPTVGYIGFGLNEYNALRNYGIEARPELSEEELTVENIVADYPLGSNGEILEVFSEEPLPEDAVANYLAARERKLRLSEILFQILEEENSEAFQVLIGIDDSSAENSIQKNEIAYLRAQLRSGDALLSGVDDLAFKAVAKLYMDEQGSDVDMPSIYVSYYGGTEEKPACAYDYKALELIVEEHIDFFGLTRAEAADLADMQMLVLTQPADPAKSGTYFDGLIRQLNENEKAQCPTILIDAGNGQYGTAFHEKLVSETNLGWLISYAGFLDMAIVTGTAMSHGVARYVFLQQGQQTEQTERAFIRTVADSILKDFCYKHIVRNEILNYVRGDLAGNADNFWQPPLDLEKICLRLEEGMRNAAEPVIENLERSNFVSSLEPYEERGWGGIALENYRFPWDRAFEIGMDIRLGEFTETHKDVLGFYYQ